MSITTYSELKTAATNWLRRGDLSSFLDDLVTVGETRIFRELRNKDMETSFNSTIASGTISTPTSYIDLKFAYIDGSPTRRLKRRTNSWIYENYPERSSSGKPSFIAREGSTFIFGPYSDSNHVVKGIYYKNIGPVSSSAHVLFTNNPDLYLYATLCAAEPFLKNDKRVALWEAEYGRALAGARKQSEDEEISGGGLAITAE